MRHQSATRPSRFSRALTLAVGLALGLAAASNAEPGAGAPPDQALKGPRVNDLRAPGTQGDFGGGGGEGRGKPHRDRLDARAFHEALTQAVGPDAPAEFRASPDQREKVEAIMSDFRRQMHDYMDKNRDEISRLRGESHDGTGEGNRKGPGRRGPRGSDAPAPDAGGGAPKPEDSTNAQAARQRFRAIMEAAPKPDAAINQVWQVLSPAQKQAVESRLADIKSEHAKERNEKKLDRRSDGKGRADGPRPAGEPRRRGPEPAGRRGPDDDGPADAPHARGHRPPGPPMPPGERVEQLRAMIDRLAPDERHELLEGLADHRRNPPPPPPPRRHRDGDAFDHGDQMPPPPPEFDSDASQNQEESD